MVCNMKTTVEISDSVFRAAKEAAREDETTLRALIESGLRRVLEERARNRGGQRFRLRDGSVKGDGLRPEWEGRSWSDLRDAAYEGHGP